MAKQKAKSPYQKYQKAPYRYSDIYQQWRAAVRDGKTALARKLGEEHTERFMFGRVKRAA